MLSPKPNIAKLVPGAHGGIDYAELEQFGIRPEDVLDFSVSTNPFGPPLSIKEVMNNTSSDRYPDSESTELKQALAQKLNITTDSLIIGSGSTELIRLVALSYLGIKDSALIPQPTYGEYEIACHLVGTKVIKQPVAQEPHFHPDIANVINMIQVQQSRAIFLCNPNNPTGHYLTEDETMQILSIARDRLVILDEAYIAFTRNGWNSLDLVEPGNLVILRSMTKDYALAGLRLGYAIAAQSIISVLKRVKPPWNVSSVAQKAGILALQDDAYLEQCGTKIQEAKEFLYRELKSLGLSPLPSQTNFFLFKVGNATEFRRALLKKGILVRDCTSFGLPQYVRLAPRTLPECQKLVEVIRKTGVHHRVS